MGRCRSPNRGTDGAVEPRPAEHLAMITGASSGIGGELALLLARRGVRTILIARRPQRLEDLAAECSRYASSYAAPVALGDALTLTPSIEALLASHGTPDVLLNNAGYGLYRPFLEHTLADHWQLMQVNYFAAVIVVASVLPGMLERGSGRSSTSPRCRAKWAVGPRGICRVQSGARLADPNARRRVRYQDATLQLCQSRDRRPNTSRHRLWCRCGTAPRGGRCPLRLWPNASSLSSLIHDWSSAFQGTTALQTGSGQSIQVCSCASSRPAAETTVRERAGTAVHDAPSSTTVS
jgi:hypothetical protein